MERAPALSLSRRSAVFRTAREPLAAYTYTYISRTIIKIFNCVQKEKKTPEEGTGELHEAVVECARYFIEPAGGPLSRSRSRILGCGISQAPPALPLDCRQLNVPFASYDKCAFGFAFGALAHVERCLNGRTTVKQRFYLVNNIHYRRSSHYRSHIHG